MTIKNPIEWTGAQFAQAAHVAGSVHRSLHHVQDTIHSPMPALRHIRAADIWQSLREGFVDFEAYRSDVIFLGVIYALVGLVMARIAFRMDLLPLLFPLASGFAIVGPFAAIGLYEMSRQREQGANVSWVKAFGVLEAPAIGSIVLLGLLLVAVFLLWLAAAWVIFQHTLGPVPPASPQAFVRDVFLTGRGQTMIVLGVGTGFIFALLAMMISVVSFPLLIDRDVGLDTAIKVSFRAVMDNPGPMALWGAVVAASLIAGTALVFVGLIVVVPVLGHATWHLYRKLVA